MWTFWPASLGNWRTSSSSGPAYWAWPTPSGWIVDGRVPVGTRLPSERALADALHVSRTTVTAAFTALRETATCRPAAAPQHRHPAPRPDQPAAAHTTTVNLAAAALSAPSAAVLDAFAEAARDVTPHLAEVGHELSGVRALRRRGRREIHRAWASHRSRPDHESPPRASTRSA